MKQILGKSICRDLLINKISSLNSDKDQLDQKISENLIKLIGQLLPEGFRCAGSFQALKDEPSLSLPESWVLSYPKVVSESVMGFYQVSEIGFEKGSFGINEPVENINNKIPASGHDFIIVPAVGFSAQGDRLGRGKGYYDQYLAEYEGLKIGVGYSNSLATVSWLPEEHDVALDYVVTENQIMKVL